MILISRLLMLIIVVVLLVFCMSNLDSITVRFLGWQSPQMPLFLILLFVFFFGFFLALFWQALRGLGSRHRDSRPSPSTLSESQNREEKETKKEKPKKLWGRKKQQKESSEERPSETEQSAELSPKPPAEAGDEPESESMKKEP